jgi:hypothetical protein
MSEEVTDTVPSDPGHLLQALASEAAYLNLERSLAWSDGGGRVGTFLSALGAATVTLSLLAQAVRFGPEFEAVTALIMSVVLFLGITTFLRIVHINLEDTTALAATNRLRRGYLDIAPELARYLSTSTHDDERGVWDSLTMGVVSPVGGSLGIHVFVTTPATVGVMNAVVAAVVAGAIALLLGAAVIVAAVIGVAIGLVLFALQARYMYRQFQGLAERAALVSRFPSTAPPGPGAATGTSG